MAVSIRDALRLSDEVGAERDWGALRRVEKIELALALRALAGAYRRQKQILDGHKNAFRRPGEVDGMKGC